VSDEGDMNVQRRSDGVHPRLLPMDAGWLQGLLGKRPKGTPQPAPAVIEPASHRADWYAEELSELLVAVTADVVADY
jgi:hypothetical protein